MCCPIFPHRLSQASGFVPALVLEALKCIFYHFFSFSFQRLQAEKEVLYNDSRSEPRMYHCSRVSLVCHVSALQEICVCVMCRTKIEEINQRKEEELKALNTRIQKLQSDLMAANQVSRRPVKVALLLYHLPSIFCWLFYGILYSLGIVWIDEMSKDALI